MPAEFVEPAFTAAELDTLVAPLALYPDALVALILPAATEPSDLVLAARFLKGQSRSEAELEAQPWIDSVKLLARYPTVISWLDQELAWSKRLGEAFARQPADVMTAIQRRRAQARASGALRTTPQHVVSEVESNIVIVPAQPDVIYVPVYDPFAVYVSAPIHRARVVISFGRAYSCGYWLAYGCDWGRRTICYVDRPHRVRVWREPPRTTVIVTRTWSHPVRDPSPHWRTWSPRPHRPHSELNVTVRGSAPRSEVNGGVPPLAPFSGAPVRSVNETARTRADTPGVADRRNRAPSSGTAWANGVAAPAVPAAEASAGSRPTEAVRRPEGARGYGSGRDLSRERHVAPTSAISAAQGSGAPATVSSESAPERSGSRIGESRQYASGNGRSSSPRVETPRSAAPAIANPGVLSYASPSPSSDARAVRREDARSSRASAATSSWTSSEAGSRSRASETRSGGERSWETRSVAGARVAESAPRGGGSFRSGERESDTTARLPD